MSKSKFLNLSKKIPLFKKLYFFYNIYIRNYKFLKNGSQFQEDKFILSRFPKDYKGTYLDIGCYHPTRHNNTYLLYKAGWKGINIDLNPLSIELFDFLRPKDTNINAAISNEKSEKKLYYIGELNTQNTLDENQLNFLKNHHNVKQDEIIEKKIETIKIDTILNYYNHHNIDFLNLDVEGYEYNILKTINFYKININYLCIEMINHNEHSIENGQKIQNLLEKNNYIMIQKFDFNYIYQKKI